MEETLGKRIASNRKQLGITQDRMAEQLGVTAQAVSKWENDQSCPDIAMLPRLAELFGISVDALLGRQEAERVYEAEVVGQSKKTDKDSGVHLDIDLEPSRKNTLGLAVWVLLIAAGLFAANYMQLEVGFGDLFLPSGLFVFGVFGLYPKFSFIRFGCALFGAYFLVKRLELAPFALGRELLLPAFLLLFGLSLLADSVRRPRKNRFRINHNGKNFKKPQTNFTVGEDSFDSSVSFAEDTQYVELPALRSGSASVSFGELTVDLRGCETVAPDCTLEVTASFGELTVCVPRRFRVISTNASAFGNVDITGRPDAEPVGTIRIDANASFGEIDITYV